MKKSTLIKMLNKLEGDPDILLWDDTNDDFLELEKAFESKQLVKLTFDAYVKFIEDERKLINGKKLSVTELKYIRAKYDEITQWALNPWVSEDDITNKIYEAKKVWIVKPAPRKEVSEEITTNKSYK